jgi:hypothetical protein
MDTEFDILDVAGLEVQVVRKDIRNLHLGVYPPDGRIRIAVPQSMSDSAVRTAVVTRLSWIKRHQADFAGQARESAREMVTGESHWFLGRRYRLTVIEASGRPEVRLLNKSRLVLKCEAGTTTERRRAILEDWYRQRLRESADPLLRVWLEKLELRITDWQIRKMKTKWGSYSAKSGRVTLNLELAKKPRQCIDYIVLHELAHLLARRHGPEFKALLDTQMPRWRFVRAELGVLPIPDPI